MSYHHQWLYIRGKDDSLYEVINGARTAAYLAAPPRPVPGCADVGNVLDFGGCEAYAWNPPCETGKWEPMGFTTPAGDLAPWYSESHDDSGDALGFFIEEWTGLDSGHVRRAVTDLAAGGGAPGRAWSGPRVMKLNVLVFGLSEPALEYLFRWLESTLLGVCGACDLDSVAFRRYCPDADETTFNPNHGVSWIENVSCIEGPIWEAPPTERSGCFMRRVSFTLMAGDPCIYSATETNVSESVFDLRTCAQQMVTVPCQGKQSSDWTITDDVYPTCDEATAASCVFSVNLQPDVVGTAAPVVTISNKSPTAMVPRLEIAFYANIAGLDALESCTLPLLGSVRTMWLPPSSALIYDVAHRKIWYEGKSVAGRTQGWPFITSNAPGVQRFFGVGCQPVLMVIRVAAMCWEYKGVNTGEYPYIEEGDTVWIRRGTFLYAGRWQEAAPVAVAPATISVSMVERFGCV